VIRLDIQTPVGREFGALHDFHLRHADVHSVRWNRRGDWPVAGQAAALEGTDGAGRNSMSAMRFFSDQPFQYAAPLLEGLQQCEAKRFAG